MLTSTFTVRPGPLLFHDSNIVELLTRNPLASTLPTKQLEECRIQLKWITELFPDEEKPFNYIKARSGALLRM